MSKNQINYLLGLATFVVIWLYFNTFFAGAVAQKKMTAYGAGNDRLSALAMAGRNPQEFFNPAMNQNRPAWPPSGARSSSATPLSAAEIQKRMMEAQRKKPLPNVPEKT